MKLATFTTTVRRHGILLFIIALAAVAVNVGPWLATGIPNTENLSSDATVHIVLWQEDQKNYDGAFANDQMFQANNSWTTGQLFMNKVLVRIGEFFHLPLYDWNMAVSALSLLVFLSGVYVLTYYLTKRRVIAFCITLASIIPIISLGLSSWGFTVNGFVPKDTALGISVWITLLYSQGVIENSRRKVLAAFMLLGIFSNWYSVIFFHFALVLITAEVLRYRAIRKEQFVYGILFLLCSPLALFDLYRTLFLSPPLSAAVIVSHYTQPLLSVNYLVFHYLRKQIIYVLLVSGLWYWYVVLKKRQYPAEFNAWFAVWFSSLVWSLIGVVLETYTTHGNLLLSRTSVWFYFISMLIVGYTVYELVIERWGSTRRSVGAIALILIAIFLAQSSLFDDFRSDVEMYRGRADYLAFMHLVLQTKDLVPAGTLLLADPGSANAVRAYGQTGTFVAAKDGNVVLYDGAAAVRWNNRYAATEAAFKSKDGEVLEAFAVANGLHYILYDDADITTNQDALDADVLARSGPYVLVKI